MYIKEIDGVLIAKERNQIVIIKDNMQILNPSEEMVLEDGWQKKPEPTEEELLQQAKNKKIQEILEYDSSSSVNECFIQMGENTLPYWANKTERNDLKDALKDCIALGRTQYRLDLRDMKISVSVSCEDLMAMLSALEVYAIDCYNNTTDHIYAIEEMNSISEIELYDYTIGYPEKLRFTL